MIIDTVQTDKVLRSPEEIAQSLIKFRDLLYEDSFRHPPADPRMFFLINTILYRGDAS